MRPRRWASLATVLILLGGGATLATAEPVDHAAVPTIEALHDSMLQTMQHADELGYQGRYDKLGNALAASFDLDFMAEKAVGRSWKKFTPDEQNRWRQSFQKVTCANYAGRFTGYSGQSFETLGVEPSSHETIIVRTRLLNPDGEDVDLNYRLRETPQGWRIIDVYLNGNISELALRRSEYSSLIKRDGFQSLVDTVDQRVAELAALN